MKKILAVMIILLLALTACDSPATEVSTVQEIDTLQKAPMPAEQSDESASVEAPFIETSVIKLGETLGDIQEEFPIGATEVVNDIFVFMYTELGVEYRFDKTGISSNFYPAAGMAGVASAIFLNVDEGIPFSEIAARSDVTEVSIEHSDTTPQFELDYTYPKYSGMVLTDDYCILKFTWQDMKFVVISMDEEVIIADSRVVIEYADR